MGNNSSSRLWLYFAYRAKKLRAYAPRNVYDVGPVVVEPTFRGFIQSSMAPARHCPDNKLDDLS
jgi:hypothetical protein